MPRDPDKAVRVAAFPSVDFRSFAEFDQYYREEKPIIDTRWRYEQSLATTETAMSIEGACGLCLMPATFTSSTAGGDITAAGRVPNWRENSVCDCERRLINRERALLHYLISSGALQAWMRVFACGDLAGLRPLLPEIAEDVTELEPSVVHLLPAGVAAATATRHLFVWVESLQRSMLTLQLLSAVAARLTPGGRFVFTAPFDARAPEPDGSGPDQGLIGWNILPLLQDAGFHDAKASLFWSNEFGYLGPLNFIFSATK